MTAQHERFTLAVDSTQICAFLDCPTRWLYGYRKNLTRKFEKRTAMDRGTVIHGLLERYYRMRAEGKDQQSSYNHAIEDLTQIINHGAQIHGLNLSKDDYQFCISRFTEYWAYYNEHDFAPLIVDGVPAVEIGFSVPIIDNDLFLLVLEGRIDFIGHQQDLIFLVDHKTQGKKYDHYSRSIQFMNYCLALQIQTHRPIDRVMINYIGMQQKLIPVEHLRRKLYYYHPRVLENWRRRLETILYQMANTIISDFYPRNENQCQGRSGYLCSFTDLCETLSPQQLITIMNTKYQEREPFVPWKEDENG